MALTLSTAAFIFVALVSANVELASSFSVKASVSCVDCGSGYDYSGIGISVQCDAMKKPSLAATNKGGWFEAKVPLNPPQARNCVAKLLGGPKQLYALDKNMMSHVIKVGDMYTTANTLTFASKCASLKKPEKCPTNPSLASSKTFDFLPQYGLPPASYFYGPFLHIMPIWGIP